MFTVQYQAGWIELCCLDLQLESSLLFLPSERVTHVVSEGNSRDEVVAWMKKNGSCSVDATGSGPALLDLSWFTESMSVGQPVEIEPRHCLGVSQAYQSKGTPCRSLDLSQFS